MDPADVSEEAQGKAVALAADEHVPPRGAAGDEVLIQLDASRVDWYSKGLLGWDLEVGTTRVDTAMLCCGCRVVCVAAW